MFWKLVASLAWIITITLVIVAVMFAAYTIYIIWERQRYSHLPVPAYTSFYLANGVELGRGDKTGSAHLVFIRWAEVCGPVFYFTVFHKVIIMFNTPELAKHVLTNSKYAKAKSLYKMTQSSGGVRFLGLGLATNYDHNDWKSKRRAINPAFHNSTLERLTLVLNDAADRLVDELKDGADTGKLVSMLDQLHRTTLDVIGQVAFSEDVLDENFTEGIYMALKLITLQFRNPIFKWLPWNIKFINEVRGHATHVRNRARRILEDRMKDISEGRQTPEDILDVLVRSMVDHFPMEDIIDEIITMFVAGQETTANVMCFFMLELGRHPAVMAKVQDEIDNVLGFKRIISQSDISQLKWTTASLKETLRLYPPTGGTTRDSLNEDEVILGYKIPKNSIIMINFFAIQYLTLKNGFQFCPERFLAPTKTENCSKQLPNGYDPELIPQMYSQLGFSIGQRSCIGRNFAYLEAKILLSKLFQHFTFELNPKETFRVENAGTFKPADGTKVFLYRR